MEIDEQPVKVGDVLVEYVHSVGAKGDGVLKVNGMAIIVPGAKKGTCIEAKVTRVCERFGFAELLGEKEDGN